MNILDPMKTVFVAFAESITETMREFGDLLKVNPLKCIGLICAICLAAYLVVIIVVALGITWLYFWPLGVLLTLLLGAQFARLK